MSLAEVFKRYTDEIVETARSNRFIVFLCGPNLEIKNAAAALRRTLKERLEAEDFDVVLGEDEGLDNADLQGIGVNPQDNEVEFIRKHCGAVVIVAGSPGSFCELGLFSWHLAHEDGRFENGRTDCIVLIEQQFEA